jgi:hypothetical protein
VEGGAFPPFFGIFSRLLGGVSGHGDGSNGRRNKVKIRCSNTLADDEGVVFATNVPGSPIQVMGRRDPRTGELCVSKVYMTSPEFEAAFHGARPKFEAVTGAEAERLVAQVYTDITLGRTASWKTKGDGCMGTCWPGAAR